MPGTVTVACRLPNGIKLQLNEPRQEYESSPVGPREITRYYKAGRTILLKGFAFAQDKGPVDLVLKNGFSLTHGVDADFFEKWMEENKDSDLVQNGFIYAAAKQIDAEAHTREYKDEMSGFEAVNPAKLPAEFRGKITTNNVAA